MGDMLLAGIPAPSISVQNNNAPKAAPVAFAKNVNWYCLLTVLATMVIFTVGDDQSLRPAPVNAMPDTAYESTSSSGISVQRSFARTLSESISVTSTFASPNSPSHYFRAMSESINIANTLPVQPPQARVLGDNSPVLRTAHSSYLPSSIHRSEERTSLFELNKKGGTIRNDVGGTPNFVKPVVMFPTRSPEQLVEVEEGSGQESGPDDNSANQIAVFKQYLAMEKSVENTALLNVSISGVLLAGTLGVLVARQPAGSSGKTRKGWFARRRTIIMLVPVALTVSGAAAIGPSAGEEYPDTTSKSTIEITDAYHLDSERNVISDIYLDVRKLDGVWSDEIPIGHYVRATFERDLGLVRDITIYLRVVSGEPRIEVYKVGGNVAIAEFTSIESNLYNRIFLTDLHKMEDTFDLRVVGGSLEIDHIVDPTCVDGICTEVFSTQGTSAFQVPEGISEITVQAWGGGGAGGGVAGGLLGTRVGGGGGGGAYAERTITVTPLASYDVVVAALKPGSNNANGANGDPSYFGDGSQVKAAGGKGGTSSGAAGAGGSMAESIGNVIYAGGNGAAGSTNGGGGGGGAGSTGTGGNASGATGGLGTPVNGGNGGGGATGNTNGGAGSIYGGGGGGAKSSGLLGPQAAGGAGAQGLVIISWTAQPSSVTLFSNDDQVTQIAFNNIRQDTATPTFRASATHDDDFVSFQVELNASPGFTGTSYTQTFSGTYQSDAQYNLLADNLSPSFAPVDGETYYVRVRASADGGPNWSPWSTGAWTFTKGTDDNPSWFQTTDAQFETGILSNTVTNGSGQVMLNSPATSGTLMSPEIDFAWVPGQASWGEVSFSTDETNGDISVSVYSNGNLISDDDLPGNSAGFSSSPIDISGLDVITYREISLEATLTDDGGTPFLNDWAATWIPITQKYHVFVGQQEDHAATDTVAVGAGPFAVAVNPVTNLIYAVNVSDNSVSVIDGSTNTVVATTAVGIFPVGAAANQYTNRIYVSNFFANSVSVIDGDTNTVVDTISVGANPVDLAVNPYTNRLYVANFGGNTVSVIDAYTHSLIAIITVGSGPYGVDFDPATNRLYVTNSSSNSVSVIDGDTNTVIDTITVGTSPLGVAANPFIDRIYVANRGSNTVSVIDGGTGTVVDTISVGSEPEGVAVNPSTNRIYVANGVSDNVSVINGSTGAVLDTITVGSGSRWLALNPFTNQIYVANIDDNNVSVIGNTYTDILDLTEDIERQAAFARSISDSVSIDDVSERLLGAERSTDDALAVLDQIEMTLLAARSASDTVTLTDMIAKTSSFSRSIQDHVTMTDSINTDVNHPIDDSFAVTDEITKAVTKLVSDSAGITDSITYRVSRSVSDDLEVTDEIATSVTRSTSDSVGVTDEITKAVTKQVADNVAVTDDVAGKVTARSVSDSISATDEIAIRTTMSIEEDISIADEIEAKVTARSVADLLSMLDAITFRVSRSIDDTITTEDEISAKVTARTVADPLSVQDNITTRVSRSLSESIGLTDGIAKSANKLVNDEVQVIDEIVKSVTRTADDDISIQDMISINITRPLTETIGITDVASLNVTATIQDEVAIEDSISMAVTRDIDDSIGIADEAAMASGRSADESLDIGDTVTAGVTRSADDQVGVTDEISTRVTKATEDELDVTDQITMRVSLSIDDELQVVDEANRSTDRSADESLDIDDSISTKVTRSIDDELQVTDETSKAATKPVSDEIEVTDNAAGMPGVIAEDVVAVTDEITKAATKPVDDSVVITDEIAMHVSRQIEEEITVEDEIRRSTLRAIFDSLALEDDVALSQGASASDSLDVDDIINMSVSRQTEDMLDMDDSIAMHASRSVFDTLDVDDQAAGSPARTADDSIGITDEIAKAVSKEMADELAVTDDVTFSVSKMITEEIGLTDEINQLRSREAPNSLQVTDEISKAVTKGISDAVQVSDEIFQPPTPKESVAITDSISIGLFRLVEENIGVSDEAKRGRSVSITDSLQVLATLTEVSWARTLVLNESLNLSDPVCTPQSCIHILNLDESISLNSGLVIPQGFTRSPSDNLSLSSSAGYAAAPAPASMPGNPLPPLSLLLVTNDTRVDVLPGVDVPGAYTYSGNATALAEQLLPSPHYINATVARSDLPSMVMVLPTYHISITPTPEIPGEDAFMTVMAGEIPAGTRVVVPIDIASTPETAEHRSIPWITLEFTPAVDTTDFALIITLLDDPPLDAQEPPGDLKVLYLDVRWIGDFAGADDPSTSSYYASPPKFRFAVSEEWAAEDNAQRDENGVPVVSLRLLDEVAGQWDLIDDIDRPSGPVDDRYDYLAHLNHLSTYAITAHEESTPSGGGGGRPSSTSHSDLTVDLQESLMVTDSSDGRTVESVGREFSTNLSDSVRIDDRPLAYKTIEVLPGVNLYIAVVDVLQESIIPPTFNAVLQAHIENRGDEQQAFILNLWYNDSEGRRAFELSQYVEVGPRESKTVQLDIPFTSPGTFWVIVEARSVPEGNLLGLTQVTVLVPWLSMYLIFLIAAAVAIFGVTTIAFILLMRRRIH